MIRLRNTVPNLRYYSQIVSPIAHDFLSLRSAPSPLTTNSPYTFHLQAPLVQRLQRGGWAVFHARIPSRQPLGVIIEEDDRKRDIQNGCDEA